MEWARARRDGRVADWVGGYDLKCRRLRWLYKKQAVAILRNG
jgi:hypothetical protein